MGTATLSRTKKAGLWAGLVTLCSVCPAAWSQRRDPSEDLLAGGSWLLVNRGDGTFHAEERTPWDARTLPVPVGELLADDLADFAVGPTVLLGLGGGYFASLPPTWYLSTEERPLPGIDECSNGGPSDQAAALADLDLDGVLDVLYACGRTLHVLRGTRDAPYLEPGPRLETTERYESAESEMVLEVGDLDENGFPDVLAGQAQFVPPVFFNEDGSRFTRAPGLLGAGEYVEVVDLDGDGHLDAVSLTPWPQLSVHRGDGRGGFSAESYDAAVLGTGGLFRLAVSDLDQDGQLDLASLRHGDVISGQPARIALLLLGRGGTLREVREIDLPLKLGGSFVRPADIASADLDGNGLADLAVARWEPETPPIDGAVLVYEGLGGARFSEPAAYPGPAFADSIVALGDVDRRFIRGDANDDGVVDISDAVAILRALFLGGPVSCGKALDADDDGRVELTDAVRLLGYLFQGGEPPPPPYPEPGIDETGFHDELGCSPLVWELGRGRG